MSLDRLVAGQRARYVASHPEADRWHRRSRRVMPGGNTRTVLHFDPFPLRVVGAEGADLIDVDGHRYVDLLGNYTAGLFGHSPEGVIAAVKRALDGGVSLGAGGRLEVELAEMITARFPAMEQVRFTNSGTEANLMAIATACHVTARSGVVVFEGGYHGGVLTFGKSGRGVNVPHRFLLARFNHPESVRALLDEDPDIACVLVEPVQGSAGCIPADGKFLEELRRLCDQHQVLLIFDEVMTSRLAPGGAQSLYRVSPDLVTLGKYVAGGMSFGAFGGAARVMATFDPAVPGGLGHAGTFNNNVVTMAAGVAAGEMLTPAVLDALNRRGDRLRSELIRVVGKAGMCVTGLGSMMAVHGHPGPVRSVEDLVEADDRLVEGFFWAALEAGFYLARRGFMSLSLEVTDDDLTRFVDSMQVWVDQELIPAVG